MFSEYSHYIQSSIEVELGTKKTIDELLVRINDLWKTLGLGSIQTKIDQKGDEQYIIFNNNPISGMDIVTVLNPVFDLVNYGLMSEEKEIKNKISIRFSSKSKSILLVDDEPDVIDALKRELKRLAPHASIKTTTSPSSVKKLLEKDVFDIIIIDYKMTTMTGIDVLEEIKDG